MQSDNGYREDTKGTKGKLAGDSMELGHLLLVGEKESQS